MTMKKKRTKNEMRTKKQSKAQGGRGGGVRTLLKSSSLPRTITSAWTTIIIIVTSCLLVAESRKSNVAATFCCFQSSQVVSSFPIRKRRRKRRRRERAGHSHQQQQQHQQHRLFPAIPSDITSPLYSRMNGDNRIRKDDNEEDEDGARLSPNPTVKRNLLSSGLPDNDTRPIRQQQQQQQRQSPPLFVHKSNNDDYYDRLPPSSRARKFHEWGVEFPPPSSSSSSSTVPSSVSSSSSVSSASLSSSSPECPASIETVAQKAYHAISSTLYLQNCLDPNLVGNALATSYLNDVRPVGYSGSGGRDVGRLGLEIDGARFLVSSSFLNENDNENPVNVGVGVGMGAEADSEERAIARLALVLAAKLSRWPWTGLEDDADSDTDTDMEQDHHGGKRTRPVALYFNTLRQALLASNELRLMKALHQRHQTSNSNSSSHSHDSPTTTHFHNVRILCLGQDDIPPDMLHRQHKQGKKQKRNRDLASGTVDPTHGLILVVQPSDSSHPHRSTPTSMAKPATIPNLQTLLARAAVEQLPCIVLSPRLTEQYANVLDASSSRLIIGEQSGYQQSSTYGGVEPPRGPTPWILRDFIPPVFSWVGCALQIKRGRGRGRSRDTNSSNGEGDVSRVAMMQSVMESGHPWHLFAVEETLVQQELKRGLGRGRGRRYRYMASTKTSCGRPTQDIIWNVFSEWSS